MACPVAELFSIKPHTRLSTLLAVLPGFGFRWEGKSVLLMRRLERDAANLKSGTASFLAVFIGTHNIGWWRTEQKSDGTTTRAHL